MITRKISILILLALMPACPRPKDEDGPDDGARQETGSTGEETSGPKPQV